MNECQFNAPPMHEDCDCQKIPRDVVDVASPLYQASGGRLYRIHPTTKAKYVEMESGLDVETRMNTIERNLASNSRIYFADNIAGRDALAPLTPGDCCFVFDASADPAVRKGPAMYLWLPRLSWQMLYKGMSPLDADNWLKKGGGLKVDEDNKLYVDFSDMPAAQKTTLIRQIIGAGLTPDANGKISLDAAGIAGAGLKGSGSTLSFDAAAAAGNGLTGSGSTLAVNPAALAGTGLSAAGDKLAIDGASLAGSGIVWIGGKFNADFSSLSGTALAGVAASLIKPGGGLAAGSDGKISLDFTTISTTVSNDLHKLLRLPVYQTKASTFYVDKSHASAGDSLINGRGLSASLPFRTIQACLNYIAENVNFGPFNVTVKIGDGIYEERITLPDYTTSTGYLIIEPLNQGTERKVAVVNPDNDHGYVISSAGSSKYWLRQLHVQCKINPSTVSSHIYAGAINLTGCEAELLGVSAEIVSTGSSFPAGGRVTCVGVSCSAGARVFFRRDDYCPMRIASFNPKPDGFIVYLLQCSDATLYFRNAAAASPTQKVLMSGGANYVALCDNRGMIGRTGAGSGPFLFENEPGKSVTGVRFACLNGGAISTANSGPEFFPGSAAGIVDADTYSWYK